MARIYLSPPHAFGREAELARGRARVELDRAARAARRRLRAGARGTSSASSTPWRCRAAPRASPRARRARCRARATRWRARRFTFAATANAIAYTGATPCFVDATRRRGTSTPSSSTEELEPTSGAGAACRRRCIAVDLYGQCCDYDALAEVCARYDVPLVRGRRGGARRDLPRAAGRRLRSDGRCSRSTATRSSRRAAAACWLTTTRDLVEHARKLVDAGA